MVDSDRGMRDTVVRVSGPWDTDSEKESGAVPVVWNLDAGARRATLPTVDVEAKLRKLTVVDFNNRDWSWLAAEPEQTSITASYPEGTCFR